MNQSTRYVSKRCIIQLNDDLQMRAALLVCLVLNLVVMTVAPFGVVPVHCVLLQRTTMRLMPDGRSTC